MSSVPPSKKSHGEQTPEVPPPPKEPPPQKEPLPGDTKNTSPSTKK